MRVLVTGASGAIGPAVVKTFHERGYSIRTLSIDTPPMNFWPKDVETFTGDVTDSCAVGDAMQNISVVVHLAAMLHIFESISTSRKLYEKINIGGTSVVTKAAIRAGVKRIIFFSTIAVYDHMGSLCLKEDSLTCPGTEYARTKLEGERIILSAKRADGIKIGTVLRLGAVYGDRIKGNYSRMVHALARNRFIPIGDGLNRRTLVYDKDVAEAVVLAVENHAAAGRIYNVTDGNVHTVKEIVAAICRALGRKPPRFSLPVTPVRLAAGVLEQGVRLLGCSSPVTRATVDKYTEDIAVDGSLIQKELGFVPKYDLDSGWQETIREMRARGIL